MKTILPAKFVRKIFFSDQSLGAGIMEEGVSK